MSVSASLQGNGNAKIELSMEEMLLLKHNYYEIAIDIANYEIYNVDNNNIKHIKIFLNIKDQSGIANVNIIAPLQIYDKSEKQIDRYHKQIEITLDVNQIKTNSDLVVC